MEAKGCAKPAVWKEARRYFYWATRARLARSNALAQLAVAGPSQSREYRERLLNDLSGIDEKSDHQTIAQVLEALDISSAVAQLRTEHLLQQLLGDRKSLIDGFVRLVDGLAENEKATVLAALKNTNASPSASDLCTILDYLADNGIRYRSSFLHHRLTVRKSHEPSVDCSISSYRKFCHRPVAFTLVRHDCHYTFINLS